MKRIGLVTLGLSLSLALSGCFFSPEYKAKKHITNTKWSCVDKDYIPYTSYELTIEKSTYTLKYHADAVRTKDVQQDAVDKTVEGNWTYLKSISKSWVGNWNAHHSVTYHVVRIDNHPTYTDGAYLCFEVDSNVMYVEREEPNSVDNMKYFTRLVKEK